MMFRTSILLLAVSFPVIWSAGGAMASAPDEIQQERIERMRREAEELERLGRHEQAKRLHDQIAEHVKDARGRRPGRPSPELKELHDRLNDMLNETADAIVHGREDQAEALTKEIHAISRHLLQRDLQQRVERRRDRVVAERELRDREAKQPRRGEMDDVRAAVGELHEAIQQLRREMHEIREQLERSR